MGHESRYSCLRLNPSFCTFLGSPHNYGALHKIAVVLDLPFYLLQEDLTKNLGSQPIAFNIVFVLLLIGWTFAIVALGRSAYLALRSRV
jgi:hypothetical protein